MTKSTETAPERVYLNIAIRRNIVSFGGWDTIPGEHLTEYVRADLVLSTTLAQEAAKHLTRWLDLDLCECEGPGHSCGRTEVLRCRDKLLAATAQAGEDGAAWRPIETAPRDGGVFLGSCDGGCPFEMSMGPFGDWITAGHAIIKPTHWMPMPPPPKVNK